MKVKSILVVPIFFLTIIFSGMPLLSFDGEQIGKIGDVNKATGEITVESSKAAEKIQMGTKLYVRVDD